MVCGGGSVTIDAENDINLDANGGDIYMKDNGTTFLQITNDSSGSTKFTNTNSDFTFSSGTTLKPVLQLLNENADANSSEIKFNKQSGSAAANDILGLMSFYGYDSANNSTKYSSMEVKSKTITNGSEDGILIFNVLDGGSNKQYLDMNNTTASSITIGTTSNNIDLDVKGTIISASDIRLKENIKLIENPLESVNKLQGVSFNFKQNNEKTNYGFIAQEVEKVMPELVYTDKNGFKSVNYQNTIALLVEGMKDQQRQIDELKKRLN
jgi:hypothetical protein